MSRCILSQVLCCRSRFSHGNSSATAAAASVLTSHLKRNFTITQPIKSDKSSSLAAAGLGQTTILVQQGCEIQELPVIMRKIGQEEMVQMCSSQNNSPVHRKNNLSVAESQQNQTLALVKNQHQQYNNKNNNNNNNISLLSPEAITIEYLNNCANIEAILTIINDLPDDELLPEISVFALEKILHIGTTKELMTLNDNSSSNNNNNNNSTSTNKIYEKLIKSLVGKSDIKTLLDVLDILRLYPNLKETIQQICDELLLRNSDEMLSIVEICECVEKFVECGQQTAAEKFWSGLADQEKQITAETIKFCYEILPKLKISRRMVIGVLERRIRTCFWHLSSPAVITILSTLVTCKSTPFNTMQTISRWLNTNIHAIDESELTVMLSALTQLDYLDEQVEKALERYVKAKGVKIQSDQLIITILKYCQQFRIRNSHILNGCSEYFILNANKINGNHLRYFICPYGLLDYQPMNSVKFWKIFEITMTKLFNELSATDVIDILLSCVYLEKYPLNFVKNIFNPYFLDQMHTQNEISQHSKLRSDLKLFDTALSIECSDEYNGPMLPKDHSAKSIWHDGRIKRIVQNLQDQWSLLAGGGDEKFTKFTVHQMLPYNQLYVIDVLLHPAGMGQLWKFNVHTDRNVYLAIVIHLPEHYDSKRQHLIGAQQMRIRHFRRLGLRVVQLDYEHLLKLRVHSRELHKYLVEQIRNALPALG